MGRDKNTDRCPRCDSPNPLRHPAMQLEGEVQICPHPFHPLTADTITDEQIKSISMAGEIDLDTACVAIGLRAAKRGDSRSKARARCAEILNARILEPSAPNQATADNKETL